MHYRPSDDVIVEEQGGEAFLLHVPTARYYGLNRSGMAVWQALRDGADPATRLAGTHPTVTEDRVRGDVERVLGQLLEAGLVIAEP